MTRTKLDYEAELGRLERENADLLALLREVEWGGSTAYGLGTPHAEIAKSCPVCGSSPKSERALNHFIASTWGHAPDCRLAALLRGHP